MHGFSAEVTDETNSGSLRVDFDQRLKLQFKGTKLSSGGGLIVFRELGEAIALTQMLITIESLKARA